MARANVLPAQGIRATSDRFAKTQLANAVDSQRRDNNSQPFGSGVWLKGNTIAVGPSSLTLTHSLGHVPSGFILTKTIGGTVWLFAQAQMEKTQISFVNTGAGAVTFDVWVF